jgi:hypothetical protein
MKKQNVTLSLSKDVLKKVKIIAVERETSLSGLMTDLLKSLILAEEGYEDALKRQTSQLKNAYDLGTKGKAAWGRGELHDR